MPSRCAPPGEVLAKILRPQLVWRMPLGTVSTAANKPRRLVTLVVSTLISLSVFAVALAFLLRELGHVA